MTINVTVVSSLSRHAGLSVMLTGDVVNAAGEAWKFAGNTLHVATIHVIVDPANVAHVRSQTLQLFVATDTADGKHSTTDILPGEPELCCLYM